VEQSVSLGHAAADQISHAGPTSGRASAAAAYRSELALALASRQGAARTRFLRLWREHRDHLQALGRRWLAGNPVEAEDALADVFCKACASYGTNGVVIADERAWLSRMLHNRCMDAHRRRRAAVKIFQETSPEDEGAGGATARVGLTAISPEEELLNAELGRIIHAALAELPDSLRGPIIMRLVHDEPYGKVAQAYDISMANARKRIQQARALLRARLSGYMRGGE
jgi:RNA polymerase sigma-70 factor (ECF subfamily)